MYATCAQAGPLAQPQVTTELEHGLDVSVESGVTAQYVMQRSLRYATLVEESFAYISSEHALLSST